MITPYSKTWNIFSSGALLLEFDFLFIDECYRKFGEDFELVEDFFGSRRRRDSSYIIAKILDISREGAFKTQIMYRVSLSFAQVNAYLSLLLDLKLIEVVENPKKTVYKTTDKGLRYLKSYREIKKLLKKEKGNNVREVSSLHLVKRGTRVILL